MHCLGSFASSGVLASCDANFEHRMTCAFACLPALLSSNFCLYYCMGGRQMVAYAIISFGQNILVDSFGDGLGAILTNSRKPALMKPERPKRVVRTIRWF